MKSLECFSVLSHLAHEMMALADSADKFMVVYSYDSVDYILPAYDEYRSLITGECGAKSRPLFVRNRNGTWAGVTVTAGFASPHFHFGGFKYTEPAQLCEDILAAKDKEPRKTVISLLSFMQWATAKEDTQALAAPVQRLLRDWLRDFPLIGSRVSSLTGVFQALLKRLQSNHIYYLYTNDIENPEQFRAVAASYEFIVWDLLTRESNGGFSGVLSRALIIAHLYLVHFDIPRDKTWREASGLMYGSKHPIKLDGELEILDTCPDSSKPLNVTGGFSLLRKNAGRCYASFGHGGVDTAQFYSEDVSAAIDFLRKHKVACVAVDEATPAYAAAVALRLNIIEKTETPLKMYARFLRGQLVEHVLLTDVKELRDAVDVICI